MSGSKREIPHESPQQDTYPPAYGRNYASRSRVEVGDDQRTNSSDDDQSKAEKQNVPRSPSPSPPPSRRFYQGPDRPPSPAGYSGVTSRWALPPTGSTAAPEEDSPYREIHQHVHANNSFLLWADIVDDERTNPVLSREWHRPVGDQYTEVRASPTPSQKELFAQTAAGEEHRTPEPRGRLSGQESATMIDRRYAGFEPRALSPGLSYRERQRSVSPENIPLQNPVDVWTHPHKPYSGQAYESLSHNLDVKIEVIERRATLLTGPHKHNAHPFSLQKMTLRDYQDSPPLQGEGRVRIIHFERYGMEPGQKEALSSVFKLPEAFWGAKGNIGGFYESRKFKERPSGGRSRRERVVVRRESILLLIGKFHSKSTKNFHWASPHFYLRANGSSVDLFCLDIRRLPTLVSTFADSLSSSVTTWHIIRNPFLLHTFIFREWRFLSTSVFWSLRDRIFKLEEADSNHDNYKSLHELAKHVTQQANEVQSNALDLIMSIEQDHDAMIKELRIGRSPYYDDPEDDEVNEEWECYENTASELKSLVLAMKLSQNSYVTLERRVENQINLAFNLAQQRDSRVATNIADATRTDSIAMKTISIVTLVFLPATAVGTIFSMPFFDNSDGQRLQLTRDFWIYWVVTVPITLLTVGAWHFWQQSLMGEDSTASDRLRETRVGMTKILGRGEDEEQSMVATEQLKKPWARHRNADVEPGTYELQ